MKKITPATEAKTKKSKWYVYIVRCGDNSLYTGVTTDVSRRIAEHNSPRRGARYTRSRQPVSLVYYEGAASRSDACKREHQVKKMRLADKSAMIEQKRKNS